MRNYEFVYVIAGDLKEEEIKKIIQKITELIKKNEGKILKEEVWGKKPLAYQIKKQNYGFYVLLNLEIDPLKIQILEKELKLIPEILRYLFIKIELKKAIKKIVSFKKTPAQKEKEIKKPTKVKIGSVKKEPLLEKEKSDKKIKKVKEETEKKSKEIEEKERREFLDKKLEEILKE